MNEDMLLCEKFHARRQLDIQKQSTCSVSQVSDKSDIIMDMDVVQIYASTRPLTADKGAHSEVTCEGKLISPATSNSEPRTVACLLRTAHKLFQHLAEYRLLLLDGHSSSLLGEPVLLQDDSSRRLLHDVCLFSHSTNKDASCVAVSVGVTASIQGSWHFWVFIHWRLQNTWTVETFPGNEYIVPCFDFNPVNADMLALAGVNMMVKTSSSSSTPNLVLYNVARKRVENERSLSSFLELGDCDDKQVRVHYSPDGHTLLVDVREQCGYIPQLFQSIYILSASSLCTLREIDAGCMRPCHLDCWSFSNVVFSKCSTFLFVNVGDTLSHPGSVRVVKLPPRLNLKHQCRASVIRNLKSQTDILHLPIPGHLQEYLSQVMPKD